MVNNTQGKRKTSEMITKSLDSFMNSDMQVAVIKGKWGVGKTYFWKSYIQNRIKNDFQQDAYSYISLFGNSNLDDVKRSIFRSSEHIKETVEGGFENLFNNSGNFKRLISRIPGFRRLSEYSEHIPGLMNYSSLMTHLEYKAINNYLICIDDIERKSESLKIKEVMGLIDELAQNKSCKIVMVFNEDSLDSEKEEYETYREKIVDLDLHYNPTHEENILCVIHGENEYIHSKLLTLLKKLGINNIRIIKKICWVIDELWEYVKESENRLIDEFLVHVALLCWSYYKSEGALPFQLVHDRLLGYSWIMALADEKDNEDPNVKTFNSIAANLSLTAVDYDQDIVALLKDGYIDKSLFKHKINELSTMIERDIANERLRDAWDLYANSFEDNLDEFKSKLHSVILDDIEKINIRDFSSAVKVLNRFGDDGDQYIDPYVKAHMGNIRHISPNDPRAAIGDLYPPLVEKINVAYQRSRSMSIDEIALKISDSRSWSSEDSDFLEALSEDYYYEWMMSSPDELVKKINGGLLKLKISNVINALKRIAATSEYNKMRVKLIYGLDVNEESQVLKQNDYFKI